MFLKSLFFGGGAFNNFARYVYVLSHGEGLKSNQKMFGYSYNIQATVVPVGISFHVISIIASWVQNWLRLIITLVGSLLHLTPQRVMSSVSP